MMPTDHEAEPRREGRLLNAPGGSDIDPSSNQTIRKGMNIWMESYNQGILCGIVCLLGGTISHV